MSKSLTQLVAEANTHKGSWKKSQLAIDIDFALWDRYDPDMQFIYPIRSLHWDDLLAKTIADDSFDKLTKDQTLSILFGLHHRSRIIDDLWFVMFEQGVSLRLFRRLLLLDSDKY